MGGIFCIQLIFTLLPFSTGYFRGYDKGNKIRSNIYFLVEDHLTSCSTTWSWRLCCWVWFIIFCLTSPGWVGAHLVFCVLLICLCHSVSISLPSGLTKCSKLIFYFSYLSLGNTCFSKKLWSCSGKEYLEAKIWALGVLTVLVVSLPQGLLSGQN